MNHEVVKLFRVLQNVSYYVKLKLLKYKFSFYRCVSIVFVVHASIN